MVSLHESAQMEQPSKPDVPLAEQRLQDLPGLDMVHESTVITSPDVVRVYVSSINSRW